MGYCNAPCPEGETECCICCEKQEMCNEKCDDFDAYEYAEDCERYETEMDPERSSL